MKRKCFEMWFLVIAIAAAPLVRAQNAAAPPPACPFFRIEVRDEQTERGVPLVELATTNNLRFITDSAGVIAFSEPGLMDAEVFFTVRSHGYEFPADGFGIRGTKLTPRAGGSATIKIKRRSIAERLYRITGGGIYRDSVLLGDTPPIANPLLNAQVLGQDSSLCALYRGKIRWFWGDTNRPAYPLGNFQSPGATSLLPREGGLDPAVGVNLTYFTGPDGFARGLAPLPEEGAVWIDGLVSFEGPREDQPPISSAGRPYLLVAYARVKSLEETLERGIMQYNDEKDVFERIAKFDVSAPVAPGGHPLDVTVGDHAYWYFARGAPLVRCERSRAGYLDLSKYEAFTCLKVGTPLAADGKYTPEQLDRDAHGAIQYQWRRNTPPLYSRELAELFKSGALKADEALLQPRDPSNGKPVLIAGGSCYWNPHRRRWVMIFGELFGTSVLGEIWYAEADTPLGPWVYARKIITHEKYSFYNPRQDVLFDRDDGRTLFIEGTYATTFSGNENPTPLYDYNQIMYRLNLDDPRLVLPVAVYESAAKSDGPPRYASRSTGAAAAPADGPLRPAFFACDRPAEGLVAIMRDEQGALRVASAAADSTTGAATNVAFFAFPPTGDAVGPLTTNTPDVVPLYEYRDHAGRVRRYSVSADESVDGASRGAVPVCRVWRSPLAPSITFEPAAPLP